MEKAKTYDVSGEIVDLFEEARAAKICQLDAIDRVWKAKKAIRYARIYSEKIGRAWHLVRLLYPELDEYELWYDENTKQIKKGNKINIVRDYGEDDDLPMRPLHF
jgi:hypothetical protein